MGSKPRGWARLSIVVALLLVVGVVAAACGGGKGADKLTLVLDWFPNADHAGIYAAVEQGYFTDEGLDVEIQTPGETTSPPQIVAGGRADIGISYEPDVIQARAQGIPITAVGAIVPVPLNSIQTLKTSGITSPAQLAGKKIGYPGIPSNEIYIQTVLKRANVDPKSVQLVDVGFSLSSALRSKQVDAIIGGYWNVEAVEADLEGFPVNVLKVDEYGVPKYDELVFIVKEGAVKKNADKLRRFLRAVVKGHEYAARNPQAAIDAVAAANTEMRKDLIDRGVRLLAPIWEQAKPFGHMDQKQWQAFHDFLLQNKLIDDKLDMDKVLTNELLPK